MKGKKRLFLGMGIYGIVFLILTALGLTFLWKYMASYELSRPKYAADAYLEQLTPEQILQNDPELAQRLDTHIQSWDSALHFVEKLLTDTPVTGRKSTGSTYLVRCGEKVIGSFSLREESTGPYGLPEWTVEEEHYDCTQFLSAPETLTVPSAYHVLANGALLDEAYITQRDIPYDMLEPFYGKYALPSKVTYTIPGVLGGAELEVTDENGLPAVNSEDGQWITALDNCTGEESARLEDAVQSFLTSYISFAGSAGGYEKANYYRLSKLLVPGGELSQRLRSALDGLSYGQSRGNVLSGWEKHLFNRIDDTHYFCDVTYTILVTGNKGTVDSTENLKIIFTEISGALLVEAIDNY